MSVVQNVTMKKLTGRIKKIISFKTTRLYRKSTLIPKIVLKVRWVWLPEPSNNVTEDEINTFDMRCQ